MHQPLCIQHGLPRQSGARAREQNLAGGAAEIVMPRARSPSPKRLQKSLFDEPSLDSPSAAPSSNGLTNEQQQAIRARDVSVALSAGAGCGKTFVLTERYLSYLNPDDPDRLEPTEIGQLLAITFTDRAAREMRDRIRRKCFERLQTADDPRHSEYWAALSRALDSARISTIHSF